MSSTLSELVNAHLKHRGWSFEKLAKNAGLPRNTVYRWTNDEVSRVRHWQDVVKMALALELGRFHTDALLQCSGHPSLNVLVARARDDDDRELLSHWKDPPPHNLPSQLTSFVGRQLEMEHLISLVSHARLVTLTGTGGSGKTRIAIELAAIVMEEFDEVVFVDLASIPTTDLVMLTISQTLGLTESDDEPQQQLIERYLRQKTTLLVLDNFEQVVDAAPLVSSMLSAAPNLKIIVTSRIRLDIRGERECEIRPFAVPDRSSTLDNLRRNPAVTLFCQRAETINAAFHLTHQNAPLVADICRRLDGLPLGIELVAARTRHMDLTTMIDQFPGSLKLAQGGARDLPPRQRTLWSTIQWSYDLLTLSQQTIFQCVAVFPGSFTDSAIAAIARHLGHQQVETSDDVIGLREHNLIKPVPRPNTEVRFVMLETIQEFALEQLRRTGHLKSALDARYDYLLELIDKTDLTAGRQSHHLSLLAAEQENIRATLERCKESGLNDAGLRLVNALMPYWHLRDHLLEARDWLESFGTTRQITDPRLRGQASLWRGLLHLRRTGDHAYASELFRDAKTQFEQIGDLNGISETLQAEGDVYRKLRHWEPAKHAYRGSLKLAMKADNAHLVAHAYMGLALCTQETGNFADAGPYWQHMLEWARASGNRLSIALALNGLGEIARHGQQWDDAERLYTDTLTLAEEIGNDSGKALALHNLGIVALHQNDTDMALSRFTTSLSLYASRHHYRGMADCLAGLCQVWASRNEWEHAARHAGATEALLGRFGSHLDRLDRLVFVTACDNIRRHLGSAFENFLAEGSRMSLEDVTNYAMSLALSDEHR